MPYPQSATCRQCGWFYNQLHSHRVFTHTVKQPWIKKLSSLKESSLQSITPDIHEAEAGECRQSLPGFHSVFKASLLYLE